MNAAQREQARESIIDAAEQTDVQVRRDYSGRGMYGTECLGIVGTREDLHRTMMMAQAYIALDAEHGTDLNTWFTLPAPQQDSMGLDTIYYWPELGD